MAFPSLPIILLVTCIEGAALTLLPGRTADGGPAGGGGGVGGPVRHISARSHYRLHRHRDDHGHVSEEVDDEADSQERS